MVKKNCLECRRPSVDRWVRRIPWRREWQPTPVFLPGESHGQRSLAGYSPWGRRVGQTEQLTFPMSPRTSKKDSLCLHYSNNMVYAEHLRSFWSPELRYMQVC